MIYRCDTNTKALTIAQHLNLPLQTHCATLLESLENSKPRPIMQNLTNTSPAITTLLQMMETLPPTLQNQVVQHLQEYLLDLQDELQWDTRFTNTQPSLIAAARQAKAEIAAGQATTL